MTEVEPVSEVEILRSKLRTQGRVINQICEKNAGLTRLVHGLQFQAKGQPTPRIVKQIKQIRDAAGTNSVTKILRLIAIGRLVAERDGVL